MEDRHLWEYESLPVINSGKRPNILLVGNGINRAFDAESWEDLICNALSRNKSIYAYDDIRDMPATMQIVVATAKTLGNREDNDNNVSKEAQIIANSLCREQLDEKQADLIGQILDLPINAILNTNYSNEFELFATNSCSRYKIRCCQRRTKPSKGSAEQFRLFQFSSLGKNYLDKTLWHIHGDITKPSSMVIGHYYYGRLLKQIEIQAIHCKRLYSIAKKKGIPFKPESWVDYFLIGDVYIVGLGMYLPEQDLWWLLSFKEQFFSDTKVYFYQAEKKINKDVKKMLQAYGAEPITEIPLNQGNYVDFYRSALRDIQRRITAKEDTHHV